MYQAQNLSRLSRDLSNGLEEEFSRVGLFFRIFERVKSSTSVDSKINSKGEGYYSEEKKIQDIIGIRIVPYFPDDIHILYERLKKIHDFVDETIDKTGETNFNPIRINLIFRLPKQYITEFNDLTQNKVLDSTFEIQLRTILSEGWHEVDHDLRYKCVDDWKDSSDLSRNLNGVLATLETSEYAILRIFDQLSYRHYKSQDLIAMIRTKFRLRLTNYKLSDKVSDVFNRNTMKEFYKIDRNDVINYFLEKNIILPLTLENFILIINYQFVKNQELIDLTPKLIVDELT